MSGLYFLTRIVLQRRRTSCCFSVICSRELHSQMQQGGKKISLGVARITGLVPHGDWHPSPQRLRSRGRRNSMSSRPTWTSREAQACLCWEKRCAVRNTTGALLTLVTPHCRHACIGTSHPRPPHTCCTVRATPLLLSWGVSGEWKNTEIFIFVLF